MVSEREKAKEEGYESPVFDVSAGCLLVGTNGKRRESLCLNHKLLLLPLLCI